MRPNKDQQYLEKLRDYYAKHYILPSYSTIADLIGTRSKSAVFKMVGRLKEKGYLESAPCRRLKPGRRFFAGQPAHGAQGATCAQFAHDGLSA